MAKDTDERTTPKWFFDILNTIFKFKMDVAATDENHLCDKYHTIKTNGLTSAWSKSNFCNPPYSRGEIVKWVNKASLEWYTEGNSSVLLIPGDISTKWFALAHGTCQSMFGLGKRLKFNGQKNSAKFGTIIVIYGYPFKIYLELENIFSGNWLRKGDVKAEKE